MPTGQTKTRLYVSAPLAGNTTVELASNQNHYLAHVLRIGAGETLSVFNGHDGEWRATVETLGKNKGALRIDDQVREQKPEPDIWLAFAPIKKTRTDFIVEKATELGAARLMPVFTQQTATTRVNAERLQATATESAEQCERLTVPEVAASVSLENLCKSWPQQAPARTLFVLDETGYEKNTCEKLVTALNQFKSKTSDTERTCGFLAGPEGGLTTSELDGLRNLPFVVPVTLGSRILRAETAVVAALACYQALIES